jgi:signal transduction histidine kinase
VRIAVVICLQLVALLSTPYAWAAAVREGRDRLAAQERLADARHEEALREERAAMARDLHDTLAGELAAIAIHAEAGLAGGGRERAALQAVRASSVAGLEQTRAMIRVLRSEDEALTAPGRLEQLPRLLERFRAAGLSIVVEGAPPALPIAADQAAARILQESLTNALKHASGGAVRIRFAVDDDIAALTIDSRGGVATAVGGDGLGIAMMHERAVALGGDLTAGPHDGGWRVVATLPIGAGG